MRPNTIGSAAVLCALAACASPRRPPLALIVSFATSQECALSVHDADVSDWRTVRAARFSFCVPQSWTLDEHYQQFVAPSRSQQLDEPSWKPAQRRDRVRVASKPIVSKTIVRSSDLLLTPHRRPRQPLTSAPVR